jgi:uracil-DNA glycosylase family 4
MEELNRAIISCRKCPRLVRWREQVAREKRAAFVNQEYWGRPLPGFGDLRARVLVVGLAPAAHGGNRTGRMFTGDRSGDWLYRALFQEGFANQEKSVSRDDSLKLQGAYVSAVVRCAPPENRPTPDERDNCLPYLAEELRQLRQVRVIVALGSFAWDGVLTTLRRLGHAIRPKPRFGHGKEAVIGPYRLIGSYHPSQQNTFTGKLTEQMLDRIFRRAREWIDR